MHQAIARVRTILLQPFRFVIEEDTSTQETKSDVIVALMRLTEFGDCGHRNVHCWRAIIEAVEQWSPQIEDAILEAHFEDESLRFVFKEPGRPPREATVDISWIGYSDQAERLGILAKMALVDIELDRIGAKDSASRN